MIDIEIGDEIWVYVSGRLHHYQELTNKPFKVTRLSNLYVDAEDDEGGSWIFKRTDFEFSRQRR